jgi:hypothetical protein
LKRCFVELVAFHLQDHLLQCCKAYHSLHAVGDVTLAFWLAFQALWLFFFKLKKFSEVCAQGNFAGILWLFGCPYFEVFWLPMGHVHEPSS